MTRSRSLAGFAAIALLALTGCYVQPQPDIIVLHYSGGAVSSKKFQDCIDPGTKQGQGLSENFYGYPTRQVSYDASQDDGAERGRFRVVSKDGADLYIPVSVTMTLITDCNDDDGGTLRQFHEALGLKYKAYWEPDQPSDEVPAGWVDLLNFIVGKPLDATLDRIALQYNWQEMRSDPTVKAAIDQAINDSIDDLVARQAGGEFFDNFQALSQKPDPVDEGLLSAIATKQKGLAEAAAARAKAKADILTARAETKRAQAEAAKQRAEIQGYLLRGMSPAEALRAYNEAQAVERGLNPWQPTLIAPNAVTAPTAPAE